MLQRTAFLLQSFFGIIELLYIVYCPGEYGSVGRVGATGATGATGQRGAPAGRRKRQAGCPGVL